MGRMQGLVALVTGAGRGIGAAIALRYAREGATVVVTDLDAANVEPVAQEARRIGVKADAFASDVRDPAQSVAMVARAVEKFGRLDVLVNNAGVIRVRALLDTTPEDWDFIHSVNARGLFFALQAGGRQMLRQAPLAPGRPSGKIINMASIAGRYGRGMLGVYCASKAVAINVTQTAAHEFAPRVTVNAICPGPVDTDMWKQIDSEWSSQKGLAPGSVWEERVRGVPMKRGETPEDLTGMAVFLAGSESDYITGQSYHVDGGVVMN